MGKSPEIIKAIDEFSETAFGIKRTVATFQGRFVTKRIYHLWLMPAMPR